jgi:hypothetical protein
VLCLPGTMLDWGRMNGGKMKDEDEIEEYKIDRNE